MDSYHPAFEDVDQVAVDVRVGTDDRGGAEQRTRLPNDRKGFRPISLWSFVTEEPVFEAEVDDHLRVEIDLVDADAPDSAEPLGSYRREFSSDPEGWLGHYLPEQSAERGPEDLEYWQVFYRIERAEAE